MRKGIYDQAEAEELPNRVRKTTRKIRLNARQGREQGKTPGHSAVL